MSGIKQELALLAALLTVVVVAYVWFIIAGAPPQNPQPVVQQPVSQTAPIPPLTPAIVAQLQKSHGFQMFVSYTDRGFEPTVATIKTGDTVRFTNNSSHDLWIAAVGASSAQPVYPGTSDCGASAFDTCAPLKPGDFWEFTFTQSGTWAYQNNLDKADMGTIEVGK